MQTVLALTGGIGGAKLALGLAGLADTVELHVLVNTADDFEHLGLHISPDIDTLIYTLAGKANAAQGWGLEGETFHALEALGELGGDTWFRLGDRDLATHLWRSQQLVAGESLSSVTAQLARRQGLCATVHAMSDSAVRTTVHSERGSLPFQQYFVRERCAPAVTGFSFEGIQQALPNAQVMRLLKEDYFSRIIICPSNPFVSIDPILQLPGLWQALRDTRAPVSLVSPIVAGQAIKGPTAKMMAELGVPATAGGVAEHYLRRYPGLLDHFVLDESDATLAAAISDLGVDVVTTNTVMHSLEEKRRLARWLLQLRGD
ncbi:MAG: 2-phospho-L-lactate transferase [Halioglobus sp.]|nr:2-phospho-L-lactate transferase [Halioglobus sp.]